MTWLARSEDDQHSDPALEWCRAESSNSWSVALGWLVSCSQVIFSKQLCKQYLYQPNNLYISKFYKLNMRYGMRVIFNSTSIMFANPRVINGNINRVEVGHQPKVASIYLKFVDQPRVTEHIMEYLCTLPVVDSTGIIGTNR